MTEPFGPPSPAALRLGSALRALCACVLSPGLDDERRTELAGLVEPVVRSLEPTTSRYTSTECDDFRAGARATVNPRGTHPFYGEANPAAADMQFEVRREEVALRTRFDIRHEGAPGWAHGGAIATGFDIVLGRVAALSDNRGPTRSIDIDYTAPVPIGVDVVYRGWVEEPTGRGVIVRADLRRSDTDQECAAASGVFIRYTARTGK